MKLSTLIAWRRMSLCLPVVFAALSCWSAVAAENTPSLSYSPAYPTTVWISTEDTDSQVMAFDGRRLKISDQERTRTVPATADLQLKRAASFAIGFVTLRTIEAPHRVPAGDGFAGAVETKVELTSRFGYNDLFMAGMLCDSYFLTTDRPISLPVQAISLVPVGQIEPNQPLTVTVTVRYRGYADMAVPSLRLFVYSGGRELRSNTWCESAALLEKIERVRHARAVLRQLERGKDRSLPVAAYAQPTPDIPMEYLPPGRHQIPVHFRIKEDGTVSQIEVGSGPPLLRAAVEQAVSHWLFLPAVKDGQPMETPVKTMVEAEGPPACKG